MVEIEKEEETDLLERMKTLREILKSLGGKEALSEEEWLRGNSSVSSGTDVESVDQFVIKKKGRQ